MKTIVFLIEYDGTNYSGWQKQKNSNSVQGTIEDAFFKISNLRLNIVGAGRTDAGVHALGQVAHCRVHNDFTIPEKRIKPALNGILPNDIRILDSVVTEEKFHSTKDAIAREYVYFVSTRESVFWNNYSLFYPYKLDFDKLDESSKAFLGKHNFVGIAKKNPSTKDYSCNVELSEWVILSPYILVYKVKANRFVYGLVRSLVGLMLDVGRGKRKIEEIRNALSSGERDFTIPLVKAKGLFLKQIYYPEEKNFFKKNLVVSNLFII
ncbi:MAG: tRNA pseudouridine(38-40) synthase TruA [Ignavibacteria bacterium]|nr:tRNA pseudouridine(38-40) synthase TruA [Ignavibacteria bacterium]